jgi:hypothetical protein
MEYWRVSWYGGCCDHKENVEENRAAHNAISRFSLTPKIHFGDIDERNSHHWGCRVMA